MLCVSSLMFQIPYHKKFEPKIVNDSLGHEWRIEHVVSGSFSGDWQIHLRCTSSVPLSPDSVIGTVLLTPRTQCEFRHLRFSWTKSEFVSDSQKAFSVPYTDESIYLCIISFYKKKIINVSTPDQNVSKPREARFQIPNQLSEDMLALFRKEYFTDVSLKCGSDLFKAHKSILTARSPVFSAMFHSKMKESQEDTVNIGEMAPETLLAMLEYLYSGQTTQMSVSKACVLLSASEMYQIDGLKAACADFLISSVGMDNVLDILVVSDLYGVNSLKSHVVSYICENFDSLESTPEWLALQKEKPSLMCEVMSAQIKSLKTNVNKGNSLVDPGIPKEIKTFPFAPQGLSPTPFSFGSVDKGNSSVDPGTPKGSKPFPGEPRGTSPSLFNSGRKEVSEVASVKVPVKDDIALKLKQNQVLTEEQRQFLVKHLDDHYDYHKNVDKDSTSLDPETPKEASSFDACLKKPAPSYSVLNASSYHHNAGSQHGPNQPKAKEFVERIPCALCGKMVLLDSFELEMHESGCRPVLVSFQR